MLIEHFIIANNSSIDVNTNSLSVFGVMDDMQIQAPAGMPLNLSFHAILVVKREREMDLGQLNSSFMMSVFAPNGTQIGQDMRMPVMMQASHRRARLRVIAEIPLTQSGTYRLKMVNGENAKVASEVGLHIQIMPVAVPSPPSGLSQ